MASTSPRPPSRPASLSDSGSSGRISPINGYDSSAALILVPDSADPSGAPFDIDISSEDEEEDEDEQRERLLASPVPPLSSPTVFLYLLAPFLKLGATLVADVQMRREAEVLVLLGFAGLAAFTRQIWYMLARYVRRADMEEIVLEAFARGRGHDTRRRLLRYVVRGNVGVLRILLAAVYLRASTDALIPLLPTRLLLPSNITTTLLLALIILPLYYSPSLGKAKVVYATWTSIAAFVAWMACMAYTHAKGMVTAQASSSSLGSLWEGIPVIAFAFTTGSTIPLYASLKGDVQPELLKQKRSKSFKLLSLISVAFAFLLILPLVFFQSPNHSPSPTSTVRTMTAIFSAAALSLAIPSILITSPALPVSFAMRRLTNFPISKTLVYVVTISLSLCPQPIFGILSDVLLVLAFLSTYMLPAFIHIILHNFRRPLSIIIPPSTPAIPRTASASESDSRYDELLQRKERTLQRRRLVRRIVWDIGVWTLLVPVGGGGLVWAVGRIAGQW
ncbi:hypothetical protein OBBRIDRAFT_734006 [Obba rivulosa]|uniref:Uncharacterized protein n=1 Tax=Obba rivulosa TaxID=1052685 RepID=A0A8E2AXY5_9APHY|nr:hypothetical protein OBBRIDRAFT_734006 [Obba rivulosa]